MCGIGEHITTVSCEVSGPQQPQQQLHPQQQQPQHLHQRAAPGRRMPTSAPGTRLVTLLRPPLRPSALPTAGVSRPVSSTHMAALEAGVTLRQPQAALASTLAGAGAAGSVEPPLTPASSRRTSRSAMERESGRIRSLSLLKIALICAPPLTGVWPGTSGSLTACARGRGARSTPRPTANLSLGPRSAALSVHKQI